MAEKAQAAGSNYPELAGGKLRLYSMRFCPYAQRTRLVLSALQIPHETVNINLKSKPEWFLERNPLGLVPVLEQDGKIVYESAICNEYLTDVYGGKTLVETDPYKKARNKIIMEGCGKITDKFYTFFRVKTEDEKKKGVEELHKALTSFENILSGKFFGGDHPSIVDVHIFPWFERFPAVERLAGVQLLPAAQFPKLSSWVAAMRAEPFVKATTFTEEQHLEFINSYLSGGMPNYDIGL